MDLNKEAETFIVDEEEEEVDLSLTNLPWSVIAVMISGIFNGNVPKEPKNTQLSI
jgi:hypothetical protein